jgi:hypothetical protein
MIIILEQLETTPKAMKNDVSVTSKPPFYVFGSFLSPRGSEKIAISPIAMIIRMNI